MAYTLTYGDRKREHTINLMTEQFPTCPLCNSIGQYNVGKWDFTEVECEVCKAKFKSLDFKKRNKLNTLMLSKPPQNISSDILISKLNKIKKTLQSINFWKELQRDQNIINFQKEIQGKLNTEYKLNIDEKIIQKTSDNWKVYLSKQISGSLTLTNHRIIVENLDNSIYLKEISKIDIPSILNIELSLGDDVKNLRFEKRNIGHAVDQFASVLLGSPYEAGSWQEEVSSYTSYWASLTTMAVFLFGNPNEKEEKKKL